MRVTMLSWEYPPLVVGGLGRHVDALSRAVAAQGVEVEVVTRGDGTAPETRDKVEVSRARGGEVDVAFAVESLLAWAASADHALLRAALPRALAQAPDVVHAHDWLVAQSAVTLAQTTGAPLVTTIHATEWGRHHGHLATPLRRAVASVERWLVHQSDRVLVCSESMRAEVVEQLGADPARVDVVPGGVDVAAWGGRRPARAAGTAPVVLFAGRVEWEKGLQTVVEALPALRRARPGTTLQVAGDGGYLPEVRALAARRRVASAVTWLGRLDDAALAARYRAADAVIVPSLYEPFGLVALEAAAAGAPRVVAATGGLAEQVRDGVTGVVVPAGDPAATAAALGGLLADPARARSLAARARREARTRHGWDVVARATAATYAHAVG